MTAIKKNLGNFAAIIGLIVIAAGVSFYILNEQRMRFPFLEPKPFELKAEFSTAQAVVATLATFFTSNSFVVTTGPAGAATYLRDKPGDARIHSEYVSNATVVVVEVSATTVAASSAAITTVVNGALAKFPSTFHN